MQYKVCEKETTFLERFGYEILDELRRQFLDRQFESIELLDKSWRGETFIRTYAVEANLFNLGWVNLEITVNAANLVTSFEIEQVFDFINVECYHDAIYDIFLLDPVEKGEYFGVRYSKSFDENVENLYKLLSDYDGYRSLAELFGKASS